MSLAWCRLRLVPPGIIQRAKDETFVVRRDERRATKGSSPGRIMRHMPVFIPETYNQTNYKMFAQGRQGRIMLPYYKNLV